VILEDGIIMAGQRRVSGGVSLELLLFYFFFLFRESWSAKHRLLLFNCDCVNSSTPSDYLSERDGLGRLGSSD
jgi:hypothetical protein